MSPFAYFFGYFWVCVIFNLCFYWIIKGTLNIGIAVSFLFHH